MRCLGRQDTPSPELPAPVENQQELKDKDGPVTQVELAKSSTEQQAPLAKAQSSKTKVISVN